MSDLISRQVAIDAVVEITYDQTALHHGWVDPYYVVNRLEYLPSADLSEYSDKLWKTAYERGKAEAHPKKGEWVAFANEGGELDLRCSVCGEEQGFFFGYFNYCPNCGARMGE